MLPNYLFVVVELACLATAVNLYVASYSGSAYAGNVTTLSLAHNPNGTYTLSQMSTFNTSSNSPSWLTLDRQNGVLYMVDEAVNLTTNGTLVSYRTSFTGDLTEIARAEALIGGVYATFFASGSALAVPHYTGSTLQTYNITCCGQIIPLQTFNFSVPGFEIGPITDRQEAPHPHEAILDPTQQYLLIPDLGADLVHIFSIDQTSHLLTMETPLQAKPGSGPRHGAFSLDKIDGSYYFYLVAELAGTVTAYRVDYSSSSGGIMLIETAVYKTLYPGEKFPPNPDGSSKVAPAEVAVTPDGTTLIVSNRNDTTFGTTPKRIDSLVSYSISSLDGSLTQIGLVPADGSFPRQFALNRAGTLVAIALQNSGLVSVRAKDFTSGLFETEVASFQFVESGIDTPVCVVWDE